MMQIYTFDKVYNVFASSVYQYQYENSI